MSRRYEDPLRTFHERLRLVDRPPERLVPPSVTRKCPYCGCKDCHASLEDYDTAGFKQVGPYECPMCSSVQIEPGELQVMTLVMIEWDTMSGRPSFEVWDHLPDHAPIMTAEEYATGWYRGKTNIINVIEEDP